MKEEIICERCNFHFNKKKDIIAFKNKKMICSYCGKDNKLKLINV